ncbi:3-oxoadipate CoA-transferase beta subunit [Rhodopseudomonas rhenobacensis]|uniref:3-oxoadipate CoA-transferase beta subunit n=1 Tax=Rhodopseudomonas rhenobacensis TaxID=87461 RepID=A0A7W7Z7T5_9BRAD|nr:3-oxoacid CoA-transferase subunit B [Rhodopseudomonas rhenobacensis]MBB5049599.1 3-oxoadipate CoA-transferase beta subunit [Rhodopseudomonas rhenobacensis]
MAAAKKLSRDRVAQLTAQDIAAGSYINIGLGIPTLVPKYLDPKKEVVLHSENGILGLEGLQPGLPGDEDLINASKQHVQLILGASIVDQSLSFAMMRGGHLDATILGAFQVAMNGDIASWSTGAKDDIPGIGGAMDLVAGSRRVVVVMEHLARGGAPKLMKACSYPLTGLGVVTNIYTDMAIIDVDPARGFVVRGIAEGLSREELQAATDAPLLYADDVAVLTEH